MISSLLRRQLALWCGLVVWACLIVVVIESKPNAEPAGPLPTAHVFATTPSFPLTLSQGKRYLEDAHGQPFLIHGDAAWSLIADLTREDVDRYLEDRHARGFNTLLVSMIEHRYARNAPANAYGQAPFLTAGDFGTPNEQYFAHADWVLRRAEEKGFLVLLAPAYTGAGGGNEGWYQEMVKNGPAKLRQYGQYLGKRYAKFTNLLWVHDGDYNPPQKELVEAIAEGIQEFEPTALNTAHCAPETAAVDFWGREPWLQVSNVYTYKPVYLAALNHFDRHKTTPFFLIESSYENEHGSTEQLLRTQAYQSMLSGAMGQVFGNNPIWHFDGPGLFRAPGSWREQLGSRGAISMTHLRVLFETIPWWTLEPDTDNRLLKAGHQSGESRAVAARSADRSIAVVYLPTIRDLTLDLRELAGPNVSMRWYDPANGQYTVIAASDFESQQMQTVTIRPKANNSSGSSDWVLILKAAQGRD
jgi:uncharacterized protein DUF4038/collagenase-like protein with putative collagen-binding domain